MAVFKRKYTSRDGKAATTQKYSLDFRDHEGVMRRIAAFTDKSASLELERHLKRLVSLRMAGIEPDAKLSRFLETCPAGIRENLGKWGVIAGERAAAGKSLAAHGEDWRLAMDAKGNSKRHISNFMANLKRLTVACDWRRLSDISASGVNLWLTREKTANRSAASINHHLRAAKAFCGWAVKSRRLSENPLRYVELLNAAADRRLERRDFSTDEIRRLLIATEAGQKHHGLTGHERKLVYWLAVETGLRYSEIRSLTRASFDFASDPATVTILAKDAKNGQDDTLALRPRLVAALKIHMELLSPTSQVFRLWNGKGAAMIQVDLKAAGIPYKDENGRVGDFHALRHTYGTLLNKAGVPLVTAQRLMRHSDPKLTANIYTHVLIQAKAEAMAKLPELVGRIDEPAREAGKTVVMPVDSFCTDLEGKITTYSDTGNSENQVFSAMSEHEKAPVSQGKTGALMVGTRSATRTQDLLIKSQLLYQLS